MKRALIISYNYPPCNVVGGWRVHSWVRDFNREGFSPYVITRHWTGDEKSNVEYSAEIKIPPKIVKEQHTSVTYLPFYKPLLIKFLENTWLRKIGIRRLVGLFLYVLGEFDVEMNVFYSFKNNISEIVKKQKFDVLIVTASPLNIIQLGNWINKKYGIPWVADFRDHYNNSFLLKDYRPTFFEKIRNYYLTYYLKKWVKTTMFCTTVSKPIANSLSGLLKKKVEVVMNGFDKQLIDSVVVSEKNEKFTISHVGTMLSYLDISVFLKGFKHFIKDKDLNNIRVNFIGGTVVPVNEQRIRENIPSSILNIGHRVTPGKAIEAEKKSHVLLLVGFKNYSGFYATKTFDYIASGTTILLAPGDGDVIEQLIVSTNTGVVANSPHAVTMELNKLYEEWSRTGKIPYHGNHSAIAKHSREIQTKIFASLLLTHLNE